MVVSPACPINVKLDRFRRMPFYGTPYIILPLLSALVNAGLALFTWRRRHVQAAVPLFRLTASMSGWSLAYAVNTVSTELSLKILCYQIGTTFVCMIVPSVVALSLESVGLGAWLTRRRMALISVIPLLSILLVWTCELHALMRSDFYLYRSGPLLILGFTQGGYATIHYLYVHLLNYVALGVFFSGFWRAPRSEWPRFGLMIIATLLPLGVSAFRVTPVEGFDMTTSTLLISGACYAAAIFRHRLLDLVPVAHDTLFEMMIEPVLVLDIQGKLATANRAARELFTVDDDAIGMSAAAIFASWPLMEEVVVKRIDSRDTYLLKEEPANRSWHITKTSIEFGGKLYGWILVLRDITALQQTEEDLCISDERFRTLAENSADTIWQIDAEFRILFISNADQVMRGFMPEEVVGMSVFEAMNEEGAAEIRRINAERFRQEQQGIRTGSLRCEVQLKCKDGSLIWTEINSTQLRNGEGAIIGYIGAIRDISDRKRFEEELLAEKQKLLKTLSISDRYQAQLQELNSRIKGMVEEEERSRLYRDLHDGAGQSLHAVCLHLKMLADGRGGYDDPKHLAAQLATEVAGVAAELRDIAHQLRPSYLHEITLDTAITRRCEMLVRRGVPIDVVCNGDFASLPHEVSDNMYRIAQEAMANATRHAGARRITIRLSCTDSRVRLTVSDDGCGMEVVSREKSGMGLRIMQERATLIGATFDVCSSSTGTTISVTRESL